MNLVSILSVISIIFGINYLLSINNQSRFLPKLEVCISRDEIISRGINFKLLNKYSFLIKIMSISFSLRCNFKE